VGVNRTWAVDIAVPQGTWIQTNKIYVPGPRGSRVLNLYCQRPGKYWDRYAGYSTGVCASFFKKHYQRHFKVRKASLHLTSRQKNSRTLDHVIMIVRCQTLQVPGLTVSPSRSSPFFPLPSHDAGYQHRVQHIACSYYCIQHWLPCGIPIPSRGTFPKRYLTLRTGSHEATKPRAGTKTRTQYS
jgi:hypothetical protein